MTQQNSNRVEQVSSLLLPPPQEFQKRKKEKGNKKKEISRDPTTVVNLIRDC
jgi:hypothetical protein